MKPIRMLVAVVIVSSLMGCARIEKVKATEAAKEIPYHSLGTLEIKERALIPTTASPLWTGVEVATLTLADTPSRGERYKRSLRSKLARLARIKYGADAVINVHYWPDPESKNFPQGYLYARGEMIRYQHFPVAQSSIVSEPSYSAAT